MTVPRLPGGAIAALPFLALLGAASLVSCDLASGLSRIHRLRLETPPVPASWDFLPDLRLALSWRGPGGVPRSAAVAFGAFVEIEVERGRPQSILALPSSAGRGLRPAGALYPEALVGAGFPGGALDDAIALDWVGGYLASVALALEGEGVDSRAFNLDRLSRETSSRSSDPWILGAAETARSLAERSFRASALDDPERFAVELPGAGPWAPESPFAAPPAPGAMGSFETLMPTGLWRFVGVDRELIVSVDESGSSTWVLRAPGTLSERPLRPSAGLRGES